MGIEELNDCLLDKSLVLREEGVEFLFVVRRDGCQLSFMNEYPELEGMRDDHPGSEMDFQRLWVIQLQMKINIIRYPLTRSQLLQSRQGIPHNQRQPITLLLIIMRILLLQILLDHELILLQTQTILGTPQRQLHKILLIRRHDLLTLLQQTHKGIPLCEMGNARQRHPVGFPKRYLRQLFLLYLFQLDEVLVIDDVKDGLDELELWESELESGCWDCHVGDGADPALHIILNDVVVHLLHHWVPWGFNRCRLHQNNSFTLSNYQDCIQLLMSVNLINVCLGCWIFLIKGLFTGNRCIYIRNIPQYSAVHFVRCGYPLKYQGSLMLAYSFLWLLSAHFNRLWQPLLQSNPIR